MPDSTPSPLLQKLHQLADANGHISWFDYIHTVLYTPLHGYYTNPHKQRVASSPDADFYTASSLGKVFAELVIEAALRHLPFPPQQTTWVEIGAEPGNAVIDHVPDSPFLRHITIRPGQPADIPDYSVVFSNEVLDAQPFHRLIFRNGRWLERVVCLDAGNTLSETERPPQQLDTSWLPTTMPDGYQFDWPTGAEQWLQSIVSQPWKGLWLAFDYGLDATALLSERPAGTARTYHKHQTGNDLLHVPGDADITCHICWDRLELILQTHQFGNIRLDRQESFFMRSSPATIARITSTAATALSPDQRTLMALLHPHHFGSKFQVLSAVRMLNVQC